MHRLQRGQYTHNFESHTFPKQRKHRILLWRGNIYIYSQRGQPILECAQFKNQSLKKKKSRQTFGGMFSSKSWSTYGAYVEDVIGSGISGHAQIAP